MKKSILTLCMFTASSVSYAGFNPIDDGELGAITGQSGISIESELYATIGSLEYIDEGSLSINDIVIGGANKATYFGRSMGLGSRSGNKLDGSLLKIDVRSDGDLVLNGTLNDKFGGGIVDFGISTGSIKLHSEDGLTSATLIDSVNITGLLTGFRASIDSATLHTKIDVTVAIDDLDIDMSGLGIKIENAFIVDTTYFEKLNDFGGVVSDVPVEDLTANFIVDVYANDEGLHVDAVKVEFDMGIGSVSIGNSSIGSFALNNVNLSQSSAVISGHP